MITARDIGVFIEGVESSATTNVNIGLYSQNLEWNTPQSRLLGWTNKFINPEDVTGVSYACNITDGGVLGGPVGTVTVICVNENVIQALREKTISITGKKLIVYYNSNIRYVGVVTGYFERNEIELEISCKPDNVLNKKKIKSVTITKEMALGIEKNKAIGKSISTVYGNLCDFPLTACPTEQNIMSMMLSPRIVDPLHSETVMMYGDAPRVNDGPEMMLEGRNVFQGKNILQILGTHQDSVGDLIWVCFSLNGDIIFNSNSSDYATNIIKSFVGLGLKIISGKGSGNTYKITNAKFATYGTGPGLDTDITTMWFELDTYDIDAVSPSGGNDSTYGSDDRANHDYRIQGRKTEAFGDFDGDDIKAIDDQRFRLPYDDGVFNDNASCCQIIGGLNYYFVSSDLRLQGGYTSSDGLWLVGVQDDKEFVLPIPFDSVSVVYSSDIWMLISIDGKNILTDKGNSFSRALYSQLTTHWYGYAEAPYYPNFDAATYHAPLIGSGRITSAKTVGDYGNITSDGIEQETVFNISPTDPEYLEYITFNREYMIPFDSVYEQFGKPTNSFYMLPHIVFNVFGDAMREHQVFQSSTFDLEINLYAIDSCNLCVAHKEIKKFFETKRISQYGVSEDIQFQFSIDPLHSKCIVKGLKGFGTGEASYSLFNSIQNDASFDFLSGLETSRDIRYIKTSIQFVYHLAPDDTTVPDSTVRKATLRTRSYPWYYGLSQEIPKDKLYLRGKRKNPLFNSPTNPASLAHYIALDLGVPYIYDEWFTGNSFTQQDALYTSGRDVTMFDGQYQVKPSETLSNVLSSIAKNSLTAMLYTRSNSLAIAWLPPILENSSESYYNFTNYKSGTLDIQDRDGGYRYTDFSFSVKKKEYLDPEIVAVNTDEAISEFPSSSGYTRQGDLIEYNDIVHGWSIATLYFDATDFAFICATIRNTNIVNTAQLHTKFPIGSKWILVCNSTGGEFEAVATVQGIAPDVTCPEESIGINVAFVFDEAQSTHGLFSILSMQLYGPSQDWRELVSGVDATDYTFAKNMWDYAQAARKDLSIESKMPSEYSDMDHPIWSTDSRAITQYLIYCVKWATRKKFVVSFTTRFDGDLNNEDLFYVELLMPVTLSMGPFATSPIKGRVIQIDDTSYVKNEISFKVLCMENEAELLAILNENYATPDIILDDRDNTGSTTYNEGGIA